MQTFPILSSTVSSLMSDPLYIFFNLLISRLVVSGTEIKMKQLKAIRRCHTNILSLTLEENFFFFLSRGDLITQQSIYLSLSTSIPSLPAVLNPVVKLKYCHIAVSISHHDAFNLIWDPTFWYGRKFNKTAVNYTVCCSSEQFWVANH